MKPPLGRDAVYHADWPGNGRPNIEQGQGTVGGCRQRRLFFQLCSSKRFLQADVADHI